MSYGDFIGSVSRHARARIDTQEGMPGNREARELQAHVTVALDRVELSVVRALALLREDDNPSWSALNSEFDLFTAQHDTDVSMDYDDPESPRWWPKLAYKAKAVIDSIVGILGDLLSDRAKRAFFLLKELLDLLH